MTDDELNEEMHDKFFLAACMAMQAIIGKTPLTSAPVGEQAVPYAVAKGAVDYANELMNAIYGDTER